MGRSICTRAAGVSAAAPESLWPGLCCFLPDAPGVVGHPAVVDVLTAPSLTDLTRMIHILDTEHPWDVHSIRSEHSEAITCLEWDQSGEGSSP